jgi:ZIP family zinc transporter
MVISAWIHLIPAAAAIIGAAVAVNVRPGPTLVSAIQHFAAGVVFAAAAGEILPDIMHRASPWATMIGGGIGVATMLLVKHLEALAKGAGGLLTVIGIDILIDGLVLGIGFAAGPKVGLLLTIALTIEVLFLGLTVARNSASVRSRARVVWITAALVLLLPIGALLGAGGAVAQPSSDWLLRVWSDCAALPRDRRTADRSTRNARSPLGDGDVLCRLSGASPAGRSNWLVEPVCWWCPIR